MPLASFLLISFWLCLLLLVQRLAHRASHLGWSLFVSFVLLGRRPASGRAIAGALLFDHASLLHQAKSSISKRCFAKRVEHLLALIG